jgi:hypothetical protein
MRELPEMREIRYVEEGMKELFKQEWRQWKDCAAREGINPVVALLVAIPITLYLLYYVIRIVWEIL